LWLGLCEWLVVEFVEHDAIAPVALETIKRTDALFDIERAINGLSANDRLQRRQKDSRPLVDELEAWLRSERTKLSRSSPVTEPIDYMLKRWDGFTSFLGDGRICLTNNAAERALRGFALGRKSSHDRPSMTKHMQNRHPAFARPKTLEPGRDRASGKYYRRSLKLSFWGLGIPVVTMRRGLPRSGCGDR
jgi:hypothetical protein